MLDTRQMIDLSKQNAANPRENSWSIFPISFFMFLRCGMIHQRQLTISMSGPSRLMSTNSEIPPTHIAPARRTIKNKAQLSLRNSFHTFSLDDQIRGTTAIEPFMHSPSFSFNLSNGRQTGQAQLGHWFVFGWHNAIEWKNH